LHRIDETNKSYLVKQKDLNQFKDNSFKTIDIADGVKAVIGIPNIRDISDIAYTNTNKKTLPFINVFRKVIRVEKVFDQDMIDLLNTTSTNIISALKKERKIIKVTDAYTEEELATAINEYKVIINKELNKFEKSAIAIGDVQVKEGALTTVIGLGSLLDVSKTLSSDTDKALLQFFQGASKDAMIGLRADIQKSIISQIQDDFLNGESERKIISNVKGYFKNTQINVPEKVVNGQVVRKAYTRTMTARNRAQLITRNLIKQTYTQYADKRYKEAGVKKLEYLTARDDRVRPTHAEADGKVFSVNSPMHRAARSLMNEINCRCITVPFF